MSNKRIEMVNIKHLLRLKLAGQSQRAISRNLAMDRKTVARYVAFFDKRVESYEELLEMSDAELWAILSN